MTPGAPPPAPPAPKVWSVSLVRNEIDIVEAFVRHNASLLDGMAIVDHGSTDGTLDVLAELAREKLPILVIRSAAPGYLQERMTTAIARDVFRQAHADFVLPLDADEFLKMRSRAAFNRALQAFPPDMNGLLHWLTYVPDFDAPAGDILALLRGSKRMAKERHVFHKALMSRYLMTRPEASLANGNHFVARKPRGTSEDAEPHARIRDEFAAIAHVPIRSAAQFVTKVAVKKMGRLAANYDWKPDAASQAAYEAVVANRALDAAALREYAVNWSVQRGNWVAPSEAPLVDDPFLAPIVLRYTPPRAAEPLPLVLGAAERLVRRLAEARAARARARGEAVR
ncbi:MAG: glycosyltransferase family 2 protein [Betaproteobacteria bacterium PRO3]|nr:glycosyltransferase family 2 protein [Betaproteobacteria bacterium PRO3]